jgi:hypothetical protein
MGPANAEKLPLAGRSAERIAGGAFLT